MSGRKSSRKLSTDFMRKLSAISVASDVSEISERFGMEQTELKTIVQDILELDLNNDWEIGSEDGLSEYGEEERSDEVSLWQELRDETIRLNVDTRKISNTSTISQSSVDSLDSAEDFSPVEINLHEVKSILARYQKRKSTTVPFIKESE